MRKIPDLMNFTNIISFSKDVLLPILTLAFGVYLWFQRDRRKSMAETAVVERTVDADVTVKEAGGLGASVAFVQEAFKMERESYKKQIDILETELHRVETQCKAELAKKLAEKDVIINELRGELTTLEARLERLEGKTS